MGGACVPSTCGDGYVDAARGEECEDGNADSGDGCEPTACTFSCADAAGCDDGVACNGAEACGSSHACEPGDPLPDASACMLEDGAAGECRGGACVAPGCGNGVASSTEECDDGNLINGDGCDNDCNFSCEIDLDCSNGDTCDGSERCNGATHVCSPGTALVCDDAVACTTDGCEPVSGCTTTVIDADGDGVASTSLGACGTDCDDSAASTYPGADEFCDMVDNDCDGTVDDMAIMAICYRDSDGDAFPLMSARITACMCPRGYISRRSDGRFDCADGSSPATVQASVYPGQTRYFPAGYCPLGGICATRDLSWDYDCDGVETQRYPVLATGMGCGASPAGCPGRSGWSDGSVPACGAPAEAYRECYIASGGGITVCNSRMLTLRQECR